MSSRGRPASVDVDPQNESMQEVQQIVETNASTQSITRKVPNQGNVTFYFVLCYVLSADQSTTIVSELVD